MKDRKTMSNTTTLERAPHTLARRGGPKTSQKSAQRVAEFARHHRAQILQVLRLFPEGLTVHEIAAHCRLDAHAVGKRMSELEGADEVEVAVDLMGEMSRPSPSGRPSRVWRRKVLHVTGMKGGAA